MKVTAEMVEKWLSPNALVDKLNNAFASDISTPMRQHFDIDNPMSERETTLLVMPSWQSGHDIGVKLVTVVPDSYKYDLPSIQGVYVLMDAIKGNVKAIIDAPALTAKRTAAASALASRFLSRPNSRSLLMIGTGTLSPELIRAHASVRPIEQVFIWGRNIEKAQAVKAKLADMPLKIEVVESIEAIIASVDIISCATLSKTPLINGDWLVEGQHLDMVGAYRPDMREADDRCVIRSRVFVDNRKGAIKETGDIKIPLEKGLLSVSDIEADLFELSKKEVMVTRNAGDITFFKSVGHALEDLAAAQLLISEITEQQSYAHKGGDN